MRHYILLIIFLATVSLQFCTKPTANQEVVDFKYDSIQTAKWNQICLSTISIAPVGCAYDKTEQGECLFCLVNEENKKNGIFSLEGEAEPPFKLFIYKFVTQGKYRQTDTVFEVPDRVFIDPSAFGGQKYEFNYSINDTIGIVNLRNKRHLYFGYSFYEYNWGIVEDKYFSNLFDLDNGNFSEAIYQRADASFYPKNRYGKMIVHDSILKNKIKYNYLLSRIPGIRDSTSDTEEQKAFLALRKTNRDLTEDHIGENQYAESTLKPAYYKRERPTSSDCYENEVLRTNKFIIYNLANGVVLGYDRKKNLYFPIAVQSLWRPYISPRSISIKDKKLLVAFRTSGVDLLTLDLSTFKYSFDEEKESLPDYHDNYQSQQDEYGSNGAAH